MREEQNRIIVLKQFENSIDAHIAKAKLDAYAIPCFLTEENIAGLYPGQTYLPFGVRLHIFEKDKEEASNLLGEKRMIIDGSPDAACPNCQSKKIQRDFPKRFSLKTLTALGVLFFGVFLPHKKVNHCIDCDYEF